jgi:hypothetical protein
MMSIPMLSSPISCLGWRSPLHHGAARRRGHIEDSVPALREVLDEPRNDEAFIADLLLKMAPAVDMEFGKDMQGYLGSLARRD